MPPRPVQSPVGGAGEAWLSGDLFVFMLSLGPVPPVRVTLKDCAPEEGKEPYRYRRPPRLATLEIIERCLPRSWAAAAGGSSGRVRPARPQ